MFESILRAALVEKSYVQELYKVIRQTNKPYAEKIYGSTSILTEKSCPRDEEGSMHRLKFKTNNGRPKGFNTSFIGALLPNCKKIFKPHSFRHVSTFRSFVGDFTQAGGGGAGRYSESRPKIFCCH